MNERDIFTRLREEDRAAAPRITMPRACGTALFIAVRQRTLLCQVGLPRAADAAATAILLRRTFSFFDTKTANSLPGTLLCSAGHP